MKKLVVVFFIFLTAPSAFTQPQEPKLLGATHLVKPFVFEECGRLTGFSVEFWQELAKDMNITSEFLIKPTVVELLDSVRGSTSVEYLHRRRIAVTEFFQRRRSLQTSGTGPSGRYRVRYADLGVLRRA